MKLIRTQDAVGQVLCHDITQIIPGRFKGPVFRKGHIVQPQDIPVLLSVGKEHLYVWENDETMLHENEAAEILRQLCQNENMEASEAKEGKIELTAACDGLFLVDTARLRALNAMGDLMIATRPGGFWSGDDGDVKYVAMSVRAGIYWDLDDGAGEAQTKKPVAGHDGPGNMDRRAAAVRSGQREKGQAQAARAARGLSGKVSGLPPCAGRKILPDAFPRDPGQDDGAFSRNRHS